MSNNEIKAKKETVNDIFEKFWFVVPEYQRSYVWNTDNVIDLLDDLWFAFENKPQSEYFLGSLVLKKNQNQTQYAEYEVLDGQQRLTTLFILMSCIRDRTENGQLKRSCQERIFQEKNEFKGIPERVRLLYRIRDNVQTFVSKYILSEKDDKKISELKEHLNSDNISISNMANTILTIDNYFKDKNEEQIVEFAKYIPMKPIFIYVSTENRDDAFRLFTILNNRGVPLTNADILKSINIGVINDENQENAEVYARKWEDVENDLGEDFDRFLSFIRTILVKEKARKNLLEEFKENIYNPKKYDKKRKEYKSLPSLLEKGKPTIDYVENYKKIYDEMIRLNTDSDLENDYKNLLTIMLIGLPSDDWIPSLLSYYEKYGKQKICEYLKLLEFKFSSDWILQETPTNRTEHMNTIIKEINKSYKCEKILENKELFNVNIEELRKVLNGEVYGKRFTRFILLKYEYLLSDNTVHLSNYKTISVEHILPQNPKEDSKWIEDFTQEQRGYWTHRLANLVLISMRKNRRLSNLDFREKKKRYLNKRIDAFKGSKIFVDNNSQWKPEILKPRQKEIVDRLVENY